LSVTAEEILESEVWAHAFERVEKRLWDDFKRGSVDDSQHLTRVRACQWGIVEARKALEHALKEEQTLRRR